MTETERSDLPAGTVTFLFTDIEGSTRLLQQLGADRYGHVLASQRQILRAAFADHGGQEVDTQGDSFFASFPRASEAVQAVLQIQRALAEHDWPEGAQVRVRMGLHTGEPLVGGGGYVGMDVHRAARIAHTGHGGQVLLSEATAALLKRDLPAGTSLRDLGEYQLKDLRATWRIFQLIIDDFPADFPALNARQVTPPPPAETPEPPHRPAFLDQDEDPGKPPVFVARERELERLHAYLAEAAASRSQVVFITGSAGRGKTALLQAFARRAGESDPELLYAAGQCDAYTGSGDPYLPFRDLLATLTGDVEARWASGALMTEQARRAWEAVPEAAQALTRLGPDLVDVFLPGGLLLDRARAAAPDAAWLADLRELTGRRPAERPDLDQAGLFSQVEAFLRALATGRPLLLTLDDLQWADSASLNLIFHLGRRLVDAPVLILAAYRPEEVALGRDGGRHPLEKLLSEFKRQQGENHIDLGEKPAGGGRDFVDAYLETEPNRLDEGFRQALFAHTGGHPLFTVELLRAMQARRDLVQDQEGHWVAGEALDWATLPAKVEGVIEERIGRLEDELRDILTVASVEGEDFTAQVVARVQEVQERGLVRRLSRELDRKHRLVAERGQHQVGSEYLSGYRFRHSLFQQHLYNGLSPDERRLLHGEVGAVLETLYGERADEIALQLGWHFMEGRQPEKAVPYLIAAGDVARLAYAHQEAVDNYRRAIDLLKKLKDYDRAARVLMKLGLTFHTDFQFEQAARTFDEGFLLRKQAGTSRNLVKPLPPPHDLRVLNLNPGTLDPALHDLSDTMPILLQLFRGLVKMGPDLDILPDIAESWRVFDEGKKFVFSLRSDALWSDGTPLVAQDFEFAWKRVLDPALQSTVASFLYDLKGAAEYHEKRTQNPRAVGVQALDETTLQIELENPASYFLQLLTNTVFRPIPRHVVKRYGSAWTRATHMVSNGPFKIADWEKGKHLRMVQNPYYYGPFKGNLKAVDWVLYDDPSEDHLYRFEENVLDIIHTINLALPPDQWLSVWRGKADEYVAASTFGTMYVGFNCQNRPFDDVRVRQAFSLALDQSELVRQVSDGLDRPATGGFIGPGIPGYASEAGTTFDPEAARALLRAAGYPGGELFPNVYLSITQSRFSEGEFLINHWREILGVAVNLKIMERFMDRLRAPLFLVGWLPDFPDPAAFLDFGPIQKQTNWENSRYEQLIADAKATMEQRKRLDLYQQADRLLMEKAPIVPLFYDRNHLIVKPWVKGYIPDGGLEDVILEPH